MEGVEEGDQFSLFLTSGFYRFDSANAVFVDPVRVLNRSYSRFKVLPSAYYSRFFYCSLTSAIKDRDNELSGSMKRKRSKKVKKEISLNSREKIADQRHKNVRPFLVEAREALLGAVQLLEVMRNLRNDGCNSEDDADMKPSVLDFVELGSVWQAPLFEITLNVRIDEKSVDNADVESCEQNIFSLFDNMVVNDKSNDADAELLGHEYILPKKSSFFMSDIGKIRNLIPAESDCGFNLIVIDPPWENSSALQKLKYKSLPNRYFLSIPIKQLSHKLGALVALWVTNREKLHRFVKDELFPKWGVVHAATFYWLKVKANGSLIGELDLFHHRPYECLLLGYCCAEDMNVECLLKVHPIPDNQVFISVPGDYSRKPPIGELLLDYAPGYKPARCIELFSREMLSGWTSWGNEPLHFQDSRYFLQK